MLTTIPAEAAFGTDLYRKLSARGNTVFSPASIAAALAMALIGARGETAAEIAAALHVDGPGDAAAGLRRLAGLRPGDGLTLRAPNTLWLDQAMTVRAEYAAALGDAARISRCDFRGAPDAARQEINGVVAEQTEHKITDLIARGLIDTDTRLVLVNAIYLNALWTHKFPADKTQEKPFYPERSGPTPLPLMHLETRLAYHHGDGYQAVLLPYQGGSLAMAVVLPDGPLSEFAAGLADTDDVRGVLSGLLADGAERAVDLSLPRFRVESSFRLDDTLQALGIRRAFTHQADFSGITGDEPLAVSAVVHKAYIDVGEEGTEAAAATAVIMRALALRRFVPDVRLVVDRPFLFVIADTKTGLPLFLGQFTRPPRASLPGLPGGAAGGQAHQVRAQVDVQFRAARAAEGVLVTVPRLFLDRLGEAALHEQDEFARGAVDPLVQRRVTPVLGGGEQRGRRDQCPQVGERGPHLVVHDQRVPGGARGRGQHDRLADQQVVVEDLEERREQAARPGLVDRGGGDDPVGVPQGVHVLLEPGGDQLARQRRRDVCRQFPQVNGADRRFVSVCFGEGLGSFGNAIGEHAGRGRVAGSRRHHREPECVIHVNPHVLRGR